MFFDLFNALVCLSRVSTLGHLRCSKAKSVSPLSSRTFHDVCVPLSRLNIYPIVANIQEATEFRLMAPQASHAGHSSEEAIQLLLLLLSMLWYMKHSGSPEPIL